MTKFGISPKSKPMRSGEIAKLISQNEEFDPMAYFKEMIEEASETTTPSGYWVYIDFELQRLESRWKSGQFANAKFAPETPAKDEETR